MFLQMPAIFQESLKSAFNYAFLQDYDETIINMITPNISQNESISKTFYMFTGTK